MTPHKPDLFCSTSPLLSAPHGMFACAGVTDRDPYAPLNFSYHVGDQPERVQSNRDLIRKHLGLHRLVSVHQTHSDQILVVEEQHATVECEGYDAMISTLPGVGLLIQQADCQAILLHAPRQRVVAAVHCGWRGSVLGIIEKTVQCLQDRYAVPPESLHAAISPSLGPCCAEFINYRQELPTWMHDFQVTPLHFDFWAISRRQLLNAGLLPEHIDTVGLCTRCDHRFFSYRRASKTNGGVTGRNGSIIGLPVAN